jgi:uncharacterized protein with HEPN domain
MRGTDRWRFEHIAEALSSAMTFVRDRERVELETNQMLVYALVRALEIVGEAASKISAAGRAEFPDLPWADMIGMRNRLVHAYFDVDIDTLWDTVADDVPPLAARIKEILRG